MISQSTLVVEICDRVGKGRRILYYEPKGFEIKEKKSQKFEFFFFFFEALPQIPTTHAPMEGPYDIIFLFFDKHILQRHIPYAFMTTSAAYIKIINCIQVSSWI